MSLSLASLTLFRGDGFTIVRVQSSKCHYRVNVDESSATVQGPGVDHSIDMRALNLSSYPPEAQAIMAVLMFEEGE